MMVIRLPNTIAGKVVKACAEFRKSVSAAGWIELRTVWSTAYHHCRLDRSPDQAAILRAVRGRCFQTKYQSRTRYATIEKMDDLLTKYADHLRNEWHGSPHSVRNYLSDLDQ